MMAVVDMKRLSIRSDSANGVRLKVVMGEKINKSTRVGMQETLRKLCGERMAQHEYMHVLPFTCKGADR